MDGYVFLPGRTVIARTNLSEDFSAFTQSWDDLPVDPYLGGSAPYRYRRHARMRLDECGSLSVQPADDYLQSPEHNRLFGGVARRFAPVIWDDTASSVIGGLAHFGVTEILGLSGPVLINAHQIRIVGGAGFAGKPVPEGRHRDGFQYISIHLIGRDVDGGGETTLVADADGSHFRMTFTEPLDTVYLDDRAFTHDTSPIEGHDRMVRRDVLLMSFERPGG